MFLKEFSKVRFAGWFLVLYAVEWIMLVNRASLPVHLLFWFVFAFAAEIALIVVLKNVFNADIRVKWLSLTAGVLCLLLGVLKELWDMGLIMPATSSGTGFDFLDIYYDIAGIALYTVSSFLVKSGVGMVEALPQIARRSFTKVKEEDHISFVMDPTAGAAYGETPSTI